MNENRSLECQSMGSEYVTGAYFEMILHSLENLNVSDKMFSQQPQKIFYPFTSVDTVLSGSYKSLLKIYDSLKLLFKKGFLTINKCF